MRYYKEIENVNNANEIKAAKKQGYLLIRAKISGRYYTAIKKSLGVFSENLKIADSLVINGAIGWSAEDRGLTHQFFTCLGKRYGFLADFSCEPEYCFRNVKKELKKSGLHKTFYTARMLVIRADTKAAALTELCGVAKRGALLVRVMFPGEDLLIISKKLGDIGCEIISGAYSEFGRDYAALYTWWHMDALNGDKGIAEAKKALKAYNAKQRDA